MLLRAISGLMLAFVSFVAFQGWSTDLARAGSADLLAAQGGQCYDCMTTAPNKCVANTCVALGGGLWRQTTGSKQLGINCFVSTPGTTTCVNNTPMVCLTYVTCTMMGCTMCGPPSTTMIDTNCTLGPYLCDRQEFRPGRLPLYGMVMVSTPRALDSPISTLD